MAYPESAVGSLQGTYSEYLNFRKFCQTVGSLQGT